MKRARALALAALVAVVGGTLVFGWAYASYREARVKRLWIAAREAEGADMSYERVYMERHGWIEGASVAVLALLLAAAGVATARAVRRERELSARKSAFVATVTHELRTPLTTLRMHAEMLRDGLVTEERRARVHDELARETERLARLVENVLALSRLDEGRWAPTLEPGDLGRAVGGVLDELEPRVAERGFTLRRELDEVTACFDPRALELELANLVDNALKHAAKASERSIDVSVRADGKDAVILVRDRGPGIAAAEREAVFDRFRRAERTDASTPGVGVGLALVRELARAQGGTARALASDPGACLEVRLPRAT